MGSGKEQTCEAVVGRPRFYLIRSGPVKDLLSEIRSSKGASLIELALILPVVVILISGLIDIGYKINTVKTVASATRHAARIAASHSKSLSNPPPCGQELREICPPGSLPSPITSASVNEVARDAACNYLKASGHAPDNWQVFVPEVREVGEDGKLFKTTRITMTRIDNDCLVCYERFFESFRTESTSLFVLEGDCA